MAKKTRQQLPDNLFVYDETGQTYVLRDEVMPFMVAAWEGVRSYTFSDDPEAIYMTVDDAIDFLLRECDGASDEDRTYFSIKMGIFLKFQRQVYHERNDKSEPAPVSKVPQLVAAQTAPEVAESLEAQVIPNIQKYIRIVRGEEQDTSGRGWPRIIADVLSQAARKIKAAHGVS